MSEPPAVAHAPSRYLTIKHAQALFEMAPESLSAEQRQRVDEIVARQRAIEQRVLASPEAQQVRVTEATIDAGVAEVMSRFSTEADFVCTLAAQGLTLATLREELARDIKVEAVLEAVSASLPAVTRQDVEIFYRLHADRFQTPERRTVRHILITINDTLSGNDRSAARARIDQIRATCSKDPEQFANQALRHSECPTAMQGGLLGPVPRGQLFPTLDAALFTMRVGELSAVLESPMGFHILRCDHIHPGGRIPLAKVQDKIHAQIQGTRRANHQRAWLKQLLHKR
ncbi:nitrogen fixation protein NifM [Niveibacterium sp. 24ML]|uniref:nitrogen fixation protein NifM n=1 Tax=Niveibacterium sp. 24ML TaxID=2985512 RepID=UPI0022707815|nr:nitrogen fixation protein NifM [Niveibacterium sp. 24ML]MCX9154638.1 nitrogen fixation protein NifM [Niveibacterium sp. 24ML]